VTGEVTNPVPLDNDATNQQKREFEEKLKKFKKANGFAITLITTTMEEEPLQLIIMFKSVKEMWDKLQTSHEQNSYICSCWTTRRMLLTVLQPMFQSYRSYGLN
jgi:hypothetical protein